MQAELLRACKCGDVEEVRKICQVEDFAYESAAGSLTPLHWLMMSSNTADTDCVAIIDCIAEYGVNSIADNVSMGGLSHIESVSHVTPLHLAVSHKSEGVVGKLLDSSADPDMQDSAGDTCLHYASRAGYIEILETLIAYNADLTILNARQESPLSVSSVSEIRSHIVSSLNTLLVKTLRSPKPDTRIEPIIIAGADPCTVDPLDSTPCIILGIRTGVYEIILDLLSCGPDLEHCIDPSTGNSVLHELALITTLTPEEQVELFLELLFLRADLNSKNLNGSTPLDLVVNDVLFKTMVDHGATGRAGDLSRGGTISLEDAGNFLRSASAIERDESNQLESLPPSTETIQFTQSSAARDNSGDQPPVDLSEVAGRVGHLLSELEQSRMFATCMHAPVVVTQKVLEDQKSELVNKLNKSVTEFDRMKKRMSSNKGDFKSIGTFLELQKSIAAIRSDISKLNERIDGKNYSIKSPEESEPPVPSSGWFRSPDSIEADIEMCIRVLRKSSNLVNVEPAIFEVLRTGGGISNGAVPILKLLRNRGSDINFTDSSSGVTPLMIACDAKLLADASNEELVVWMLQNSANVLATDYTKGWNSLFYAAKRDNFAACKHILGRMDKKGPVVDKQGKRPNEYSSNRAVIDLIGGG
jgi:ankyrin repeat protein